MEKKSSTNSESPIGSMLVRRAMEDGDFRERLKEDPRSTIAEATGQAIPEDLEIVVVENGPKAFHIVLPSEDLDLSSMDVSGGDPGELCFCDRVLCG